MKNKLTIHDHYVSAILPIIATLAYQQIAIAHTNAMKTNQKFTISEAAVNMQIVKEARAVADECMRQREAPEQEPS